MKYTIQVEQNVTTNKLVTYVVEADSKEEAEKLYYFNGYVVKSEYKEDCDILLGMSVKDIKAYKNIDEPDRYMVFYKKKGRNQIIPFGYNLKARSAWKYAAEVKAFLDVQSVTDKDFAYDYISVMKQEPDLGTRYDGN